MVPVADESPGQRELARAEDLRLVGLALKGQDHAYEQLVARYTPMVVGYLYSRVPNASDAEDLAQETFFAAYRHLGRLRNPQSFGSWLMTIARAKLIDHFRKESRQVPIVQTEPDAEDWVPDPVEMAPSPVLDPSRLAMLSQTKGIVLHEMEIMSEKYRSILHWRLIGNESAAEIAARMNLRESTVRMRLFRGLKLLRKALRKYGITAFPER